MSRYLDAVHPDAGLARGFLCEPPSDATPLWTMSVDIGTDRDAHGAFSATLVGATGLTLEETVPRAVGEAVERFALRGGGKVGDEPGVPGDEPGVPGADATGALIAGGLLGPGFPTCRGTEDSRFATLEAVRLHDGAPYTVPVESVDYPQPARPDVDATPSCAAAGLSLAGAFQRAVLEAVERDAFERAWQGVTAPVAVDLADLRYAADDEERARLDTLDAALSSQGHRARFGVLATALGTPAVTALVDRDGGPVGVGCATGESLAACAVKAAMEGIQVETLLRNWTRQVLDGEVPEPRRPRNEEERLAFLCHPDTAARVAAFGASFRDGPVPAAVAPPADLVDLARQLKDRGVELLGVDLTARLPAAVVALGWVAVKVLPIGLQPLRGDDTLPWNWCLRRLAADGEPVDRTRARLTAAEPHPLA